MNHNNLTPQRVFLTGAFLLVFLALFLQVSPVPASAAEFIKVEPTATVGAEPDWEWMHETLKDSGNAQIVTLTDQQADDLSALRHNSDIFLYGIFPVTASLLLLIWFVRWFYHTFIEGGL